MAKVRVQRLRARATLSGWRLALICSVLTAFAFQSYVLQTHIHLPPEMERVLAAYELSHGGKPAAPDHDDPAHCPICQEIAFSAGFLTPAPLLLLPPALVAPIIAVVDQALPHIVALSHSWRGRAPPAL